MWSVGGCGVKLQYKLTLTPNRDDPTNVIGPYDILPMLPIAAFLKINNQLIFTDTKESAECQFGCKLLGNGILYFGLYNVQGPQT